MHKEAPFTIHKASMEDAAGIAHLMRELAAYENEETHCDESTVRRFLANDHEPKMLCYVAKASERIIGCVIGYAGYDVSSATCGIHLSDIIVTQSHRGNGTGAKLIATLSDKSDWVSLTALRKNAQAKQFYESLGFTHVGVDFYAAGKNCLKKIREK